MDFQFASRMDQFQAGIFTVLDNKRKEVEASGRRVYNLTIGTPDFKPEPHVVEALREATLNPNNWK